MPLKVTTPPHPGPHHTYFFIILPLPVFSWEIKKCLLTHFSYQKLMRILISVTAHFGGSLQKMWLWLLVCQAASLLHLRQICPL